ncbi:MAG: 3-deoxy-manno-octulosonate cytidylyltransferase [Terrimicrobiaceae bacterium]
MSRAAIIIPARWGSTRFPGKPLHVLAGKPLIQHVWERCVAVRGADQVIVATDDTRILEAAFSFGAEVALTSAKHPSGTDRIAEVAKKLRSTGILLNAQGDEPFLDPKLAERLIGVLKSDPTAGMATAACPLDPGDLDNPNAVKVVCNLEGCALYFSRSPIPFDRGGGPLPPRLRHLGIYAYRRSFLLDFVKQKPSPLEKLEKLEQLRALEHGAKIRVLTAKNSGPGIDTPEDAIAAEKILRSPRLSPHSVASSGKFKMPATPEK